MSSFCDRIAKPSPTMKGVLLPSEKTLNYCTGADDLAYIALTVYLGTRVSCQIPDNVGMFVGALREGGFICTPIARHPRSH